MKESMNHMHLICEDWKRELNFFKVEIPLLKLRLDEIVSKNTNPEILAQVEHFENKFKIMDIHLDELLHDVNLKNQQISAQAVAKPQYISVKMLEYDQKIEELMHITSKDFYDSRKEFYQFLSQVM
jgi:hypothetical protein